MSNARGPGRIARAGSGAALQRASGQLCRQAAVRAAAAVQLAPCLQTRNRAG